MNIAVKSHFWILLCLIITCIMSINGGSSSLKKLPRLKRQSDLVRQPKRLVCQYAYWAAKRPGDFKFTPSDIDATLCTHIVYDYARLEPTQGIVPYDSKEDIVNRGWESIVELKQINPKAKILLSVGGLFEGSSRFTKVAADVDQRSIFVQSALILLNEFKFDGLDITWLFPGFSQGSSNADKDNYVSLVKELKEAFKSDYILSISVPALRQHIESGFDIPELVKYVDYINVLAYSYHDSPDATVNHHGPLYSLPNDFGNRDANVDTTIREYIKRGAHPSILNLVLPFYGVAFQLEDPEKTDIGSNTEDEGIGLEEPGALIYFELCQRIRRESWTVKKVNSTAMGPYAYKDKLWVAYDDEDMVRNKAKYALQMGLGGLSFWTVDQDDFRGVCHLNNFPLLRAARDTFLAPGDTIKFSRNKLEVVTTTSTTTLAPNLNLVEGTLPGMLEFDFPLTTYRPPFTTKSTTSTTKIATTSSFSPLTKETSTEPIVSLNQSPPRKNKNVWISKEGDLFMKPEGLSAGNTVYRSNRDIVFSDFKIWIANHFHSLSVDQL